MLKDMQNKKWIAGAVIVVMLIVGFCLYQRQVAQPVTVQSQQQAETAQGVKVAADNARVELLESQLKEAAKEIAELKNKPSDKVVVTEVKEVLKVVEKEQTAAGADFAILTNPNKPGEAVDLKTIPDNTAINLNQYNVLAYKKIIRGLNVYPDWGEVAQGNFKIQEINADISRKITKDGKYLGISTGYDLKNDEAKLGLRYVF